MRPARGQTACFIDTIREGEYPLGKEPRYMIMNKHTNWLTALLVIAAMAFAPLAAMACACSDACGTGGCCTVEAAEASCCATEAASDSACCCESMGLARSCGIEMSACGCSMESSDGSAPASLPDRSRLTLPDDAPQALPILTLHAAAPAFLAESAALAPQALDSAERCALLSRFRC